MKKAILVVMMGMMVAIAARAEDGVNTGTPNCTYMVHTKFRDGKKKLEQIEVFAESRDDCRMKAREREITSGDDIEHARVTFNYRGPAQVRN